MQELEKIFKEIDTYSLEFVMFGGKSDAYISSKWVKDIIRKHMNDGWISVDDRLPEVGTRVIVTSRDGIVYGDIIYGYAEEDDAEPCFHMWDDEYWNCYKPDVIAWHPLPEPYRSERSDHDGE